VYDAAILGKAVDQLPVGCARVVGVEGLHLQGRAYCIKGTFF
jgi:hypothetical protein